jgi:hypothetical protein
MKGFLFLKEKKFERKKELRELPRLPVTLVARIKRIGANRA